MKQRRKIRQTGIDRTFDWSVNTILILMTFIAAYPMYFVFLASLSDPVAIQSGKVLFWPVHPELSAYTYILKDSRIWNGYYNTILYTAGSTVIGVIITVLGGYALSRKDLWGREFFMKIMVFTMYFNGGLVPTYMIVKKLGLVDTRWSVILLGSFTVFNLIVTRTFFMSKLPDELLEAARIDGCGNWKFFISVVLPLSKEIIAVIVLYYAVAQWNSFFTALIYVSNKELVPLQIVLRELLIAAQQIVADGADGEELIKMQRLMETIKYGVMIVASLPVLVIYPFLQRYFIKGVMIGSIKG